MNFDIKDVKSWANRHDVKIKAVTGFFGNSLSEIDNEIRRYNKGEKDHLHELYKISDNGCYCFGYAVYFADTGAFGGTQTFAFFLPLDAVKEDKPEKKYRPFKNLYEFYQFLSFNSHITEEDFTPVMLLGLYFKYRDKKALRVASTIVINRIDVDLKDICEPIIEGRNFERWFDLAEIMNDDCEWQPFGVKEND